MNKWISVTIFAVTVALAVAVVFAAKERLHDNGIFDMLDED